MSPFSSPGARTAAELRRSARSGLALALSAAAAPGAAGFMDVQVGVASDYRGKGAAKNAGDPSVNGTVEVSRGAFCDGRLVGAVAYAF